LLAGASNALLSGVITSLVVVLNYLLPHEALGLLMALVVATLLLNWIMIRRIALYREAEQHPAVGIDAAVIDRQRCHQNDEVRAFRKRLTRWFTVSCCFTSVHWWCCWRSIRG
jgi:hypothetical protein